MKNILIDVILYIFIFLLWNICVLGVISLFDNSAEILKYLFIYFGPICGVFVSGIIVTIIRN